MTAESASRLSRGCGRHQGRARPCGYGSITRTRQGVSEQFDLLAASRILKLGFGTGALRARNIALVLFLWQITLSDGMLREVQRCMQEGRLDRIRQTMNLALHVLWHQAYEPSASER